MKLTTSTRTVLRVGAAFALLIGVSWKEADDERRDATDVGAGSNLLLQIPPPK